VAIGHYETGSCAGESLPRNETGRRRGAAFRTGIVAAIAITCAGPVVAGDAASRHETLLPAPSKIVGSGRATVENVSFRGRPPVRVVRGGAAKPPTPPDDRARRMRSEIVSFGPAGRVTVLRGGAAPPAAPHAAPARSVETVRFADARLSPVTVVREQHPTLAPFSIDLFEPANGGELDRIAFAVDGIESRHGADMGMWRTAADGPQGPMQVSAAAALDVGGGDRFDMRQNRLIGRAFLAKLYERYGSWPDAIAAYNWGPGNLDRWISQGRPVDRLPLETARYLLIVLRNSLLAGPL
jgi:Transglycosylase SLT domain